MGLFSEIAGRMSTSKSGAALIGNLTKRDDLDRAIRGMVSVAYADGNADMDELEVVTGLAKEMFSFFGEATVESVINTAIASHKTAPAMGFLATERALRAVESEDEKEGIFTAMFATASRSGGVGKAEYDLMKRFADKVRFDLTKIGLAGPDA